MRIERQNSLTFTKTDLTSVEIYAIINKPWLGHVSDLSEACTGLNPMHSESI